MCLTAGGVWGRREGGGARQGREAGRLSGVCPGGRSNGIVLAVWGGQEVG